MTPHDLRLAVRQLHPQLIEPRDYRVAADGALDWHAPARFPQPSPAQLAAALAAHADAPRTIATAAFIARIPVATWGKVKGAASQNPALDKALFQLSASAEIGSDNTELQAMLTMLVSAGVLTAEERTQILGF